MVIKARYSVELDGHIYRKGDMLDYSGVIDQRIVDNFTDERGEPLSVDGAKEAAKKAAQADAPADETASKIAKTVEVMKREGIIQALDGMGITYSPKSKTDYLAKLLLMSKGEIEE